MMSGARHTIGDYIFLARGEDEQVARLAQEELRKRARGVLLREIAVKARTASRKAKPGDGEPEGEGPAFYAFSLADRLAKKWQTPKVLRDRIATAAMETNYLKMGDARRILDGIVDELVAEFVEKGILLSSHPAPRDGVTFHATLRVGHLQEGDSRTRLVGKAERLAAQALPEGTPEQRQALATRLTDIHSARGIKSTQDGSLHVSGERWHSATMVPLRATYDHRGFVLQEALIVAVRPWGEVVQFCAQAKKSKFWKMGRMVSDDGKPMGKGRIYQDWGLPLEDILSLHRRESDNPANTMMARLDGDAMDALYREAVANPRSWVEALPKVTAKNMAISDAEALALKLGIRQIGLNKMLPYTSATVYPQKFTLDSRVLAAEFSRPGEKVEPLGLRVMFRPGKPERMVAYHVGRCLEAEAVRAARTIRACPTLESFNWFSPEDPQKRAWRRQFAKTYPLLAGIAVHEGEWTRRIDAGEPLLPYIVAKTGIPKPILDRMARQPWQRVSKVHRNLEPFLAAITEARDYLKTNDRLYLAGGPNFIGNVAYLDGDAEMGMAAVLLSRIPPEWVPNSIKGWNGFENLANIALRTHRWLAGAEGENPAIAAALHHIRRHKGDWQAIGEVQASLLHAADFYNTMHRHLRWVMAAGTDITNGRITEAQRHRYSQVNQFIFGDRFDLQRLAQMTEDWHSRSTYWPRIFRAIREGGEAPMDGDERAKAIEKAQNEWLPLTKQPFVVPGIGQATWLTTRKALQAETDAMHHCVWSYGPQCSTGNSHIASVIAEDGSRATLELRLNRTQDAEDQWGWELKVIQLQRPHNGDAPQGCKAVVQALLEALQAPGQQLADFEAVDAARECRKAMVPTGPGHRRAEIDFGDDEQCAAMLDVYRRYMAKPYREMSLEALRECCRMEHTPPQAEMLMGL